MDQDRNQIEEIEATQTALRESIEQSRKLSAKTDELIAKHKQSLQDNQPSGGTIGPWD